MKICIYNQEMVYFIIKGALKMKKALIFVLLVLCLSVGVGSAVAADKLVVGIWDTNQQKGL